MNMDAWADEIYSRFINPYTITIYLDKNCLYQLGFDFKINLSDVMDAEVKLADIWGNATITFTVNGRWGPEWKTYHIGKDQFITILRHAMGCSKCSIKAVSINFGELGVSKQELEELIVYLQKISDKIEAEWL